MPKYVPYGEGSYFQSLVETARRSIDILEQIKTAEMERIACEGHCDLSDHRVELLSVHENSKKILQEIFHIEAIK